MRMQSQRAYWNTNIQSAPEVDTWSSNISGALFSTCLCSDSSPLVYKWKKKKREKNAQLELNCGVVFCRRGHCPAVDECTWMEHWQCALWRVDLLSQGWNGEPRKVTRGNDFWHQLTGTETAPRLVSSHSSVELQEAQWRSKCHAESRIRLFLDPCLWKKKLPFQLA